MLLAFHHKPVIVDVQPALFAQGAQVEAAVKGAVVVEVKVHKGHHSENLVLVPLNLTYAIPLGL